MNKSVTKYGFTIVELLIVIVVIGILAAITLVSYNGIQQLAVASALKTEVTQAVKKIETFKVTSSIGLYPADQSMAGLGSAVEYFIDTANGTYCVEARKSLTEVYSSTDSTKTPSAGSCGTQGLIGWWQLNGNGNDSSVNGYTGTLNSVTSVSGQNGQVGGAYSFVPASNSSVSVPSTPILSTNPQTFSFWVYPNAWTSPTASAFISKRVSTSVGYFIAYLNASTSLLFDCGTGTTPNRWVPGSASAPALNQWSHIVFTCSTNSGVALYVNGALIATRPTVDRSAMSSTTTLGFGRDINLGAYTLDGSMDDVRIYDRVITLGEVQDLYSDGAQ